ncbi:DUF192 domain-containing protein [Spirochaeta dissipatitropha]
MIYLKHRFISVFILFLLITACSTESSELYSLYIGDLELMVETAISEEQRQQGLMYRQDLPADQGMLFVFDRDDYYGFWMKNTYIPLSIAFIDSNRRIRSLHNMQPQSERIIRSLYPVRYALEVNQGIFEDNNISVGMVLEWGPELAELIGK